MFISFIRFYPKQSIQNDIIEIEILYNHGIGRYMDNQFLEADEIISSGLKQFSRVEQRAVLEKNAALLWVYIGEWLATVLTMSIAGFVLWSHGA